MEGPKTFWVKLFELAGATGVIPGRGPELPELPDLLNCLRVKLVERNNDCKNKRVPKTYIAKIIIIPNTAQAKTEAEEYIDFLGEAQDEITRFFKDRIAEFIEKDKLDRLEIVRDCSFDLDTAFDENLFDENLTPFRVELTTVRPPKPEPKETRPTKPSPLPVAIRMTIQDKTGIKELSLTQLPKKCGKESEVKIDSTHTSGYHFDLELESNNIVIIDRSTYGTFTASGTKLDKNKPFILPPSSSIEFVLGCGQKDSERYIASADRGKFAHVTIFNETPLSSGTGGKTPEPGIAGNGTPPPGV